ncbi:Rid family hydrolase [Rhodococcus wratislaviensis]|uniref:Rid family hydrolase n=1 Tax=Rhodococcus wratislaviensis TaxID=44752 RepID=UPI003519664B
MTKYERTTLPQVRPADKMCGTTPGLRSGPFVYISGVVGRGPDGTLVEGGAGPQARQALSNILAALDKLGAAAHDVVRTRVYLVSMDDVADVAHEHKRVFGEHLPSCGAFLHVAGLYGDARVEIECDAVVLE